jgi:hypothetical protein
MSKFKAMKEGEVLSETQFYTVLKKTSDKVQLQNDAGEKIVVDASYVDSCLVSAAQAEKMVTVSRTEIAEIFKNNPNTAMTVNYNKKVDEKEAVTEIAKVAKSAKSVLEATVKRVLAGEERTIVGRHHGSVTELGRYNFVDMEQKREAKTYDTRLRQVDPRTINYLIVGGIKYQVK